MGHCDAPQGSLSTPYILTNSYPRLEGSCSQLVPAVVKPSLHPRRSVLGGSWLSWPSAVPLELYCHLKNHPPSQHACHSVSLLLSPPVDPDTTTRVPRSSVLTAATSAAQGQVNTEQANVICDYSFYFYFGSGSRKIWLGQ